MISITVLDVNQLTNPGLFTPEQLQSVRQSLSSYNAYFSELETILPMIELAYSTTAEFHKKKGNIDHLSQFDMDKQVFAVSSLSHRQQDLYKFNLKQ